MTIFSGPTGPKILLTQNQVIMPYPVDFRIVGDGFPVPPSAPQVRRTGFCTVFISQAASGMGTGRHAGLSALSTAPTTYPVGLRTVGGGRFVNRPYMRIDRI